MDDTQISPASTSPHPVPCWSAVLRNSTPSKPEVPISGRVFGSAKSTKGISVAVVDANAIIHGDKLTSSADKFVTVSEVLDEVRDPVSRQRLAFLPLHVETMEPSSDVLKKVVKFARETGDLHTLSDVDLKVIALAYTLESQIHGTSHLKESPPPLRMVSVKNLPEVEMPGWGKNVPNLEEWEALENLEEGDNVNNNSRILPLKDFNHNVPVSGTAGNIDGQENGVNFAHRPRRYSHPKKEINIEGKKMVADGIDASQGECDDNPDDWRPAVSRSTHRRYVRRKARLATSEASDKLSQTDLDRGTCPSAVEGSDVHLDGKAECLEQFQYQCSEGAQPVDDILNEDELEAPSSCLLDGSAVIDAASTNLEILPKGDEFEICSRELDQLEITSQTDESVDISQMDDASSEQSWALRSLSESTVACVTSDFAMQNVILQIGLRLLVPGGMQIRQLHRWVLKCHACNKVTTEIGRIFCPKCGNGGTLRKVSVTVGENGIVLTSRRPRINLRGTKFSLPLPQGGRDGITKNMILREDQLPRKLLYPKKKKNSKQENNFFSADDIFSHWGEKKGPLKPPVGKALAVFSGRRNPNDNHFSRRNL